MAAPTEHSFRLKHVWVVVMQNHSYEQIIGNAAAPYINQLARRHGLATRYYAVGKQSLPNHLALVAGATLRCTDTDCGGGYDSVTLMDELEARGLTWAGYFEDLPYRGYTGGSTGGYVQHHDPFVYFSDVVTSGQAVQRLHPMSDFSRSLSSPPAFSLIEPNGENNMHDGSIRQGDDWLHDLIPQILASRGFRDGGAVFLTWDQGGDGDFRGCCLSGIRGGRVPVIVIGAGAKRSYRSSRLYSHYSLLRTVEEGFGLPELGLTRQSAVLSMTDFWR